MNWLVKVGVLYVSKIRIKGGRFMCVLTRLFNRFQILGMLILSINDASHHITLQILSFIFNIGSSSYKRSSEKEELKRNFAGVQSKLTQLGFVSYEKKVYIYIYM